MNTLYLGFYDYPYCGRAFMLNDGKFEKYDLSDAEIDMLYYFYTYFSVFKGNSKLWKNYSPYSRNEINKCVEKLSAIFSDIIVCEDGGFDFIKVRIKEVNNYVEE